MMEMTNTLNNGMCRCCSSEGTFKDIKTKYHWMGEEEVYADMLTDCFDIKISTPEDMDNGICEVCITQLRNAANFKKQVLHTEAQFKRRLQNKEIKNPIKLESMDEDPIESDHLSDPDFSSNEYEVPIKEELEDKPKAKKRAAKATTSRAKKPKAESEPAKKHVAQQTPIVKIEPINSSPGEEVETSPLISPVDPLSAAPKGVPKIAQKWLKKKGSEGRRMSLEMTKHLENFECIMRNSNATPTRGHQGLGYGCFFCEVQFPDPANLKSHTLESHADFQHSSSTRPPQLNNYSVKLDVTGLTCKICNEKFERLEPFMDHLRTLHNQPIHTDIKSYILPFRFDKDPLKCVMCESEFNAFRVIVEHMNVHFRNHICDVCGVGFVNRAGWRTHRRIHEYGDFPCKKCPQVFNSMVKLKYHHRCVHLGQDKRNKCAYCGEKFNCLVMKNNHMVKEHGVAPVVARCKACDKSFMSYQSLRVHEKRYHLLEKRFKCTLCEMEFQSNKCLERHMVKHTGARDYKCDVCHKAYGRNSTLKEHMRVHTDDRRFKCEHCPVAFIQKCSLKSHMRSKHGKDLSQ